MKKIDIKLQKQKRKNSKKKAGNQVSPYFLILIPILICVFLAVFSFLGLNIFSGGAAYVAEEGLQPAEDAAEELMQPAAVRAQTVSEQKTEIPALNEEESARNNTDAISTIQEEREGRGVAIAESLYGNQEDLTELQYTVKYIYRKDSLDPGKMIEGIRDGTVYTGDTYIPSRKFEVYPDISVMKKASEAGYEVMQDSVTADFSQENVLELVFDLKPVTYSIAYHLTEGSDDASANPVTWGVYGEVNPNRTSYTVEDDTFTLIDPQREGYHFLGWKETGSGEDESEPVAGYQVLKGSMGDKTFVPVWEIKPEIVVKAADGEAIYSGSEQYFSGFMQETDETGDLLVNGTDGNTYHVAGLSTIAYGIDVGIYRNMISGTPVVKDGAGIDVTRLVTIRLEEGSYEIKPRKVILRSASAAMEYNGLILSRESVIVEGYGFVSGQGADYIFQPGHSSIGNWENTFTYQLYPETNPANYDIEMKYGILEIAKRQNQILIKALDAEKEYDGTPLTGEYTYTDNILLPGDVLDVSLSGSVTDVGTAVSHVASYRVLRGETDVTDMYSFASPEDGRLEVTPRKITIASVSDSWLVDGTEHSNPVASITQGSMPEGEGIDLSVTGKMKYVGSTTNRFTYVFTGSAKESNYQVTAKYGTLTNISQERTLVITADSAEKVYDGQPLIANGYTYTKGILKAGDILNATVEGYQRSAGISASYISGYSVTRVVNGETVDVTSEYSVRLVKGLLKVTKRNLLITTGTEIKSYDGTPLVDGYVLVSGQGFPAGEGINVASTGMLSDVGKTSNTCTYSFYEGTDPANYSLEIREGTLQIQASTSPIRVTADSFEKYYDGFELTAGGYSYTSGILAAGDVLTATVEGRITDAGTRDNRVTSVKIMRGEMDVTDHYLVADTVPGTLTVNPAPLLIVTSDEQQKYTGLPLRGNACVSGLVAGELLEVSSDSDQLYVGVNENNYEADYDRGSDHAKRDNYEVEERLGTLAVTDDIEASEKEILEMTHDEKMFIPGEEIIFKVKAMNIYGDPQTISFRVPENMSIPGNDSCENVQPGDWAETSVSCVISEEDILSGGFEAEVEVSYDGAGSTFRLKDLAGMSRDYSVSVSQEANIAGDKEEAGLGDEIGYQVKVTNEGNVTMDKPTLLDDLTGNRGDSEIELPSLAPGESTEIKLTHVVTEKDILAGDMINTVNVIVYDEKEARHWSSDTHQEVTEPVDAGLCISQKSDNLSTVSPGDYLVYHVDIKNEGNVTIRDIAVEDELTGNTGNNIIALQELLPGEEVELVLTGLVGKDDLQNGTVTNQISIRGEDPLGNEVSQEDAAREPYMVEGCSLFADITGIVRDHDLLTYTLKIINCGTESLDMVDVENNLQNRRCRTATHIGTMEPGEAEYFNMEYELTGDDIDLGSLSNETTVTGRNESGRKITCKAGKVIKLREKGGTGKPSGIDPFTTSEECDAVSEVTLKSKEISGPHYGKRYIIGEEIRYRVSVTNSGTEPLENLVVNDDRTGCSWEIDKLDAGCCRNFVTYCVVTERDAARGAVINTLSAALLTDALQAEESQEQYQNMLVPLKVKKTDTITGVDNRAYRLTLRYVDVNHTEIAPSFSTVLYPGQSLRPVESPDIKGYCVAPGQSYVSVTAMPARNITLDVLYTSTYLEGCGLCKTEDSLHLGAVETVIGIDDSMMSEGMQKKITFVDRLGNEPQIDMTQGEGICVTHYLLLIFLILIVISYFVMQSNHKKRMTELTAEYERELKLRRKNDHSNENGYRNRR